VDFTPISDATHVSASFYLNSAEAPFPEINVVCRLGATTESPETAVGYTGELFDALCDAFDADLLGVSLPLPDAWTTSEAGIGSLIGFELLPVVGSNPVARMAEMTAHVAAKLPAELSVTVPGVEAHATAECELDGVTMIGGGDVVRRV
jgi:hypothetical protein